MKIIPRILFFFAVAASLKSQTHVSMQIDASDVVDFMVTNPAGKRSGIDPRVLDGLGDPVLLNEIPDAGYAYQSVGNLNPKGNWSVSAEFTAGFSSPHDDGAFRIDLVGHRLATFNFYLSLMSRDSTRAQHAHFNIEGAPIDKDNVATYSFTYHGPPSSPVSLTKVVSVNSLIQDIMAMGKLGWIKKMKTVNKYVNYLDSTKIQIGKNNFEAARNTLQTVLINAKKDRANKNFTTQAFKVIYSDTANLLAHFTTSSMQ